MFSNRSNVISVQTYQIHPIMAKKTVLCLRLPISIIFLCCLFEWRVALWLLHTYPHLSTSVLWTGMPLYCGNFYSFLLMLRWHVYQNCKSQWAQWTVCQQVWLSDVTAVMWSDIMQNDEQNGRLNFREVVWMPPAMSTKSLCGSATRRVGSIQLTRRRCTAHPPPFNLSVYRMRVDGMPEFFRRFG